MSTIHNAKCDFCNKQAPMKYNGEHWLPPNGWGEIVDSNSTYATGEHICTECKPKPKRKKKNEKK